MGKAQIIESLGGGQYRIRLILKRDEIIARIARYLAQICAINQELEIETQECADFYSEGSTSSSSEQSKSSASESSYSGEGESPLSIQEQSRINLLKLRKAALQKKKEQLEALKLEDPEITAWCADYTSALQIGGDVGTIEVIRERGKGVNIEPGWMDNAVYNPIRDGQIEPSIASTPAGLFYNLAMAPGSQKWRPTYRYGTITAINGNLCNVTLDQMKTGYYYKIENTDEPWLQVNQATALTDVPIEYMDCHGSAFGVDDRVIVKFTNYDWSLPKVIGFESEPVPCRRFVYCHVFHKFDSSHLPEAPPSDQDDVYRRRYAEMDPFTGELSWVTQESIEDDFNLQDNWNLVKWRVWVGSGSLSYDQCYWDDGYALVYYNYGYLQSMPPWAGWPMYSRVFTLPNSKMVFFSITAPSINIFTPDDASYVLRNVTRQTTQPRVTASSGAMFIHLKLLRLRGPIHVPPDDPYHQPVWVDPPGYWQWPIWCQSWFYIFHTVAETWPYGTPKPQEITNIGQIYDRVDQQSKDWIDTYWPTWTSDYVIDPVWDSEDPPHNVWPGGCGIAFDWDINYSEWINPNVNYNCVVGSHSLRRQDNIANEDDVYMSPAAWRSFYWWYSDPPDKYTKLMVRPSGNNYRIFAKFVGPVSASNRLLQADIDQAGQVTIISYDDTEFPEYQVGDIIIYDEDQGIDADEGMFPQVWMDTLEVRQAYSSAIDAKISEVWPGESYAGWSGACRLMPK